MAVAKSKTAKSATPKNGGTSSASDNGATTPTPAQLRALLKALEAARDGDFSVRLSPRSRDGVIGEIAAAYDALAERNASMEAEMARIGRVVGREGRMTERASLGGAPGGWQQSIDAVNALIDDLARPTTEVARVIDAVAEGDLSQKMALKIEGKSLKGEYLRIGTTVNAMVDQLGSFADEVTRVAREVGTEGKLGGQAEVAGVSGTWRDLTENVNQLASNLTDQVRNISEVTTAVANGDLSQKITVDARGEILEVKDTVNTMVDQLGSFADEVTRVAREVGTEGQLGGQAQVEGVSGTWRDLTENVNQLAGNLTGQVRNIAEVTTAVANGDLSQKITVDARGRDPRAQGHREHHGRPARLLRRRGHPSGARGGHRGQARRPGPGRGRVGHLARPHREREPARRQPHRPGAKHRRGHHRGGQRRPVPEDHRRRPRRDPRAQGHREHDGGPARRPSPTRSPGWPARWAPRASSAARRRWPASRAPGATSPRT